MDPERWDNKTLICIHSEREQAKLRPAPFYSYGMQNFHFSDVLSLYPEQQRVLRGASISWSTQTSFFPARLDPSLWLRVFRALEVSLQNIEYCLGV